jgi:hypothetical protein
MNSAEARALVVDLVEDVEEELRIEAEGKDEDVLLLRKHLIEQLGDNQHDHKQRMRGLK